MTRPSFGGLREVVQTLILTVVIFLVIQNFVAQPYEVKQVSMERTLQQGQYVLVDKLSPRWSSYSRGDIVVFHPPGSGDGSIPFIKRVIGVAGDRVEIRDGQVRVNGTAIDESSYLYDGDPTSPSGDGTTFMIGADEIFVMGDHRSSSRDSRNFGTVATSEVVGRAVLRYWPLDSLGILETPRYPSLTASGR
ncbi:MAG: signal peptidase I [Chloroflexi bacterium]|nr:signal peptidase I [Chloroflexota bacterium]